MSDNIIPSPEVDELKQQCSVLHDEIAVLLADRDHLVNTVAPNIVAKYATTIGVKEYEALNLDVEVRKLKATAEKIQAAENQGQKPNLEQIEAAVEDELKSWQQKVDKMLDEITASKDRINNLMSDEDSAELQKLYRSLAKKLHPDLNPDLTDKHKLLWERVQHAYVAGNLDEMRALALLVDDIPDDIGLPNQLEQLKKRRDDLKAQADQLIQQLSQLKSTPPHNLVDKLDDPEWVQSQINECEARIKSLAEQKATLEGWLDQWEGKS